MNHNPNPRNEDHNEGPNPGQRQGENLQGGVDLLEIYHARQMREEIRGQIRRLRRVDGMNLLVDYVRRRETRSYYEAMLLAIDELLKSLGDRALS